MWVSRDVIRGSALWLSLICNSKTMCMLAIIHCKSVDRGLVLSHDQRQAVCSVLAFSCTKDLLSELLEVMKGLAQASGDDMAFVCPCASHDVSWLSMIYTAMTPVVCALHNSLCPKYLDCLHFLFPSPISTTPIFTSLRRQDAIVAQIGGSCSSSVLYLRPGPRWPSQEGSSRVVSGRIPCPERWRRCSSCCHKRSITTTSRISDHVRDLVQQRSEPAAGHRPSSRTAQGRA